MAASSKRIVLSLYKQLLREGKLLKDYNFRNYAIRRTKDAFKENKNVTDPSQIQALITKADDNLNVLKRQVMIGHMFQADKLVIETSGQSQS